MTDDILKSNEISENQFLQSIDRTDTVSELIDKLNKNFNIITQTGIFNIKDTQEEEHDYLCDALLIKPHQPIHRRKHILSPNEDRKNVSWLSKVDYMCGDIAIVEQKRPEDESTTRVYMYTIQKSKGIYEIELTNETELTGPIGKSGEIYLSQDTLDKIDNIVFDKLNVDTINARSINLNGDGTLTTKEIITNRLQIGNLIFENTDGINSKLATNVLQVDTIVGFSGLNPETKTITFGSQVIMDKISGSNEDEQTTFETGIRTNLISSKNITDNIIINSPISSDNDDLIFNKNIKVDSLSSNIDSKITFNSKISVSEIESNNGNIKINAPIKIDEISANLKDSIKINSDITSDNILSFDTDVNLKKNVYFDESNLHFQHFDLSNKLISGQIFLGLNNIQKIIIPDIKINITDNFSKFGQPYSYVPCTGRYGIARVKKNENEWYMLISKNTTYTDIITPDDDGNKIIRIFTTKSTSDNTIKNENIYDLISSNDMYKNIFNNLYNTDSTIDDTLPTLPTTKKSSSKKVKSQSNSENTDITIGFSKYNGTFETLTNCEIDVVKIEQLDYPGMIGLQKIFYYMTLY